MSINDQLLVDYLFQQIYVQKLRCTHFNKLSKKSPCDMNETKNEKNILNLVIENYKEYYKNKAKQLKKELGELKEYNVNSYLTYNTEYYINEYNDRIEEINKYLVELDRRTLENFIKDDLSVVSDR